MGKNGDILFDQLPAVSNFQIMSRFLWKCTDSIEVQNEEVSFGN